jgi:AraC-like DNA-binding protein
VNGPDPGSGISKPDGAVALQWRENERPHGNVIQELRAADALGHKLESGDEPVEEICWLVGYEDASSFRRLYKRMVGISPGAYRRKFRLPDFVRAPTKHTRY